MRRKLTFKRPALRRDMTRIAPLLTDFKEIALSRLRPLTPAAQGGLRRAKQLRLSPFDVAILGSLGAATAGAAVYVLACALGSITNPVAGENEWRPPLAAEPARRSRDPAGLADAQTLTRPLFEKNRRPATKIANKEAPSRQTTGIEAPPAGIALKAIASQGADMRIFLVTSARAEGVWLKVGEAFEGWTVESARKSEVTLRKGDRIAHLEFEYGGAPSSPGAIFDAPSPFQPSPAPPRGGRRGGNGPT